MDKAKYRVSVTKIIEVDFDKAKLTDDFWEEFNATISDRGGPDLDYLAEHAAWNYVQGDTYFIEGIGPLDEMNINIREVDSDVEVEDYPEAA